jgi:hypothetical protein
MVTHLSDLFDREEEFIKYKVKVKVVPVLLTEHHGIKVYQGSGGTAPCIPDLSTTWRLVVSFMPLLLYPQGKSPWYPLDRRLGGPQSQSGCGSEGEYSSPCWD